jgi:hypothetical protein
MAASAPNRLKRVHMFDVMEHVQELSGDHLALVDELACNLLEFAPPKKSVKRRDDDIPIKLISERTTYFTYMARDATFFDLLRWVNPRSSHVGCDGVLLCHNELFSAIVVDTEWMFNVVIRHLQEGGTLQFTHCIYNCVPDCPGAYVEKVEEESRIEPERRKKVVDAPKESKRKKVLKAINADVASCRDHIRALSSATLKAHELLSSAVEAPKESEQKKDAEETQEQPKSKKNRKKRVREEEQVEDEPPAKVAKATKTKPAHPKRIETRSASSSKTKDTFWGPTAAPSTLINLHTISATQLEDMLHFDSGLTKDKLERLGWWDKIRMLHRLKPNAINFGSLYPYEMDQFLEEQGFSWPTIHASSHEEKVALLRSSLQPVDSD